MKAHVMKLENNCVIVDEEYFNSLKEKSELNEVRIKELSEEMFLKYIKEGGIRVSYEVNGVPYLFHHDLLNEINYDERGYPISISERVKYTIADDITEFLNNKFKRLKDEALNYAMSEFNKQQYGLKATIKIWKWLALIASIMAAVLLIVIFIKP